MVASAKWRAYTRARALSYVLGYVRLRATPRGAARQAPLSTGLPRQGYWSAVAVSSPGVSSQPGYRTCISCIRNPLGGFLITEPPGKPTYTHTFLNFFRFFSHLGWKWTPLSRARLFVPRGLYRPWDSPARTLEWAALPFSGASSHPRDWTEGFRTEGGFFTSWAPREALGVLKWPEPHNGQRCWHGCGSETLLTEFLLPYPAPFSLKEHTWRAVGRDFSSVCLWDILGPCVWTSDAFVALCIQQGHRVQRTCGLVLGMQPGQICSTLPICRFLTGKMRIVLFGS